MHAVFAQANADQLPSEFCPTTILAQLMADLPTDLIARTFELLKEEKGLDRMMRVRQVQIACFGYAVTGLYLSTWLADYPAITMG